MIILVHNQIQLENILKLYISGKNIEKSFHIIKRVEVPLGIHPDKILHAKVRTTSLYVIRRVRTILFYHQNYDFQKIGLKF